MSEEDSSNEKKVLNQFKKSDQHKENSLYPEPIQKMFYWKWK